MRGVHPKVEGVGDLENPIFTTESLSQLGPFVVYLLSGFRVSVTLKIPSLVSSAVDASLEMHPPERRSCSN